MSMLLTGPHHSRLILDSGAVIALAARQERVRQILQRARVEKRLVVIPAVVIAETTRGGPRDAAVNRVIKAVDVIAPITEEIAREAGRLLIAAGMSNATVDALVVATALRPIPTIILTGDVGDITALSVNYSHVRIVGV